MAIIGFILLVVGVVLIYFRKQSLGKAMNIKYHETTKVVDLFDNYNHVKAQLGEGSFSQIVEVKGKGNTPHPLTAEHTGRPVLYYKAEVYREYEVTVEKRDDDGNLTRNREKRSDRMSTNEEAVTFYVEDGSGKVQVNMSGAEKHTQKSLEDFRQESPNLGNVIADAAFGGSSSRTLGYRYVEHIIPVNAQLYILGEAADRSHGGELTIMKPVEKKENFIVSTKSEEEMVKGVESGAMWMLIGAIAAGVIGIGLILAGLF